jgi:hypothetical protein
VKLKNFQKRGSKVKLKLISALAAGLLSAAPAFSSTITLDFQGMSDYASILNFYNGSTNEVGESGTNYGISFNVEAMSLVNGDFQYYSGEPNPGALTATGSNAAMNVASGFTGTVSFSYAAAANTYVNVYSGLNGTGDILGTFTLAANNDGTDCGPDVSICHWNTASLDLLGVGQSIQFGNAANVANFDNVTVNAVPVPAAAWMMLSALGGLGTLVRRKRTA